MQAIMQKLRMHWAGMRAALQNHLPCKQCGLVVTSSRTFLHLDG